MGESHGDVLALPSSIGAFAPASSPEEIDRDALGDESTTHKSLSDCRDFCDAFPCQPETLQGETLSPEVAA